MRFLVLGGTAWLSSQVVAAALDAGHLVTALARGMTGPMPTGAVHIVADRDLPDAYAAVAQQVWDVVVDVSRQPGQVRGAVEALAPRAASFTFVSTGNVYADHSKHNSDETAALLPPLDGDVMVDMGDYGQAKVACEQIVTSAFGPDRFLIARPGLIGGPGDSSSRTGYWPWRFAKPSNPDGTVLVPDSPTTQVAMIDVRDLAGWIVDSAERGVHGIFDATGDPISLSEHLDHARAVAGHSGRLVAADQDWLAAHGVQEWMGPRSMPLWLSDPEWAGFTSRRSLAARAAGLVPRPLRETLADALAWELARDPQLAATGTARSAGLSDEDERELLAELSD